MKNQHLYIIGAAVFFWLCGEWVFNDRVPRSFQVAFGFLFILVVAGLVGFLISRGSAWHTLSQKYPVRRPFHGQWKTSGYFLMSPVRYEDPDFARTKHRLSGIVRIGTTPDALFLRCAKPFSFLLSPLQIPWSEISSRTLEVGRVLATPGRTSPIIQASLEIGPGGQFAELQLNEPPVFILFEEHLIADAKTYPPE